jgi:hypothetical protein
LLRTVCLIADIRTSAPKKCVFFSTIHVI